MNPSNASNDNVQRRDFLKTTTIAAGTTAALQAPLVHAQGSTPDVVRIGVIGCGGRGSGAVLDALGAATNIVYPQLGFHTETVKDDAKVSNKNVEVIALADLFGDRIENCARDLDKLGITVPESRKFTGLDAYKQLLEIPEINYVIQATPPRFRPEHVMATVEAGKNVFMEKPAAVDVPGVKTIMEAGRIALEKDLGIVAGTQRRHTQSYRDTIERIHNGEIGDIVYAKAYWNGGEIWVIPHESGWSDIEWQLRNWNYFTWLSGDHIVEQHIHNLDVMNWALQAHPIKAVSGLGGRQSRTGDRHGHIFDHFAVEYEYPGGVRVFSQCRQINGCKAMVGEEVVGSKGWSNCENEIRPTNGKRWKFRGKNTRGLSMEHANLMTSIRTGEPLNTAQDVAESTLTAIIGREACYSGREVTWDDALKSETRLGPDPVEFDGDYPIPAVAKPGTYKFT